MGVGEGPRAGLKPAPTRQKGEGTEGLLDGERGLEPLGGFVDTDVDYPLHPFEAALVGRDQAHGEAVAVGERLAADVGREQIACGLVPSRSGGSSRLRR